MNYFDMLMGLPRLVNRKDFRDEKDARTYYWETFSWYYHHKLITANVNAKSNEEAMQMKEAGNVDYKKKNFIEAEGSYIRALVVAEPNTKVYASILANVSAIKLEQRKYKSCIELTKLSMKHHSDPKLYIREMKAWMGLGDLNGAKEAFAKMEAALKSSEQQHMDKFLEESKKILNSPLGEQKYEQDDCCDMLIPEMNMNPNFLNVSENVELKFNKKYGKHVVARNDIKKGDAVLIDCPYAGIGLSQCSNCFQLCVIPYPCTQCRYCLYCSDECRQIDGEVHKWECKLYQMEHIMDNWDTCLVFRLFLKGLTSNTRLETFKNNDASCFGNAENNFPCVQNLFMDFKRFCKHVLFDEHMKGWCLLMTYIVHHTKLMDMIKEKKIFGNISRDDVLIHVTGKYLLQLRTISHYNLNAFLSKFNDTNYLLYLSYSFFNHSCEPNTSLITSIPYLMLLANEDISKGDQIFTAYFPDCNSLISEKQRKLTLNSIYDFNCDCKYCSSPHQVYNEFIPCPRKHHFCRPHPDNGYTCQICGYQFTFLTIMKLNYLFKCYTSYIWYKDIEELYCAMKLIDELNINPNHFVAKKCYLQLMRQEIELGNLENGVQYISRIGAYQCDTYSSYYIDIYTEIENFTKKIFQLGKAFLQQFKKNVLEMLLQFLTALQEELRAKFPMKSVLKGIDDLKAFYTIHLSILDLDKTVTWPKN